MGWLRFKEENLSLQNLPAPYDARVPISEHTNCKVKFFPGVAH
jgi:hypothetical protein